MPNIGSWSIGSGGGDDHRSPQGGSAFGTLPDLGSGDEDRDAIGVPNDYTVGVPVNLTGMSANAGEGWASHGVGHGSYRPRSPRYFDGDEYRPAGLTPASIMELQQQMAQGGLLLDGFVPGVWDQPSVNAYKQLLTFANARGITVEAAAEMFMMGSGGAGRLQYDPSTGEYMPAGGAGGGASGPPGLVTRVTDPEVLRSAFRRAVIDQLGTGWDQERITQLTEQYNQLERDRQQQMYDAQIRAQGYGVSGTVVEIPSADAWIDAELQRQDPQGVAAAQMVDYAGQAVQLLGSPAWGVG